MPCRQDRRVRIGLEDCICSLVSMEDVPHAHVREIKYDPRLFDIWHTLPHDMMTLMCHVVGAMMLMWNLQAHTRTRSSPHPNEVLSHAHHDSQSSHASGEKSTPPYSPSHASSYATLFSDSP